MSFVYAYKHNNKIFMIGDTKITIDDSNGIDNFKDKRQLVEELGILKTIILSNDLALGFAGNNVGLVDKALRDIFQNSFEQAEIIKILVEYSLKGIDAPDFILTYKNEKIYLIKNGTIEERDNCYIGSRDIFEELQKRRNYEPIGSETRQIVRNLIKENVDNTVGGFCTEISFATLNNAYIYSEVLDSTVTKERYIPSGGLIPLFDSAEDGGFTYQTLPFFNVDLTQYLEIQISQNNKTYLYAPIMVTPPHECIYKYLFLPVEVKIE